MLDFLSRLFKKQPRQGIKFQVVAPPDCAYVGIKAEAKDIFACERVRQDIKRLSKMKPEEIDKMINYVMSNSEKVIVNDRNV